MSSPTSRWLTMQLAVRVQDLDRVLDRDDVLAAAAVDVVDHRGEGRRLAGAGRAGDEDEPAVLLGEPRGRRRAGRAARRSAPSCGITRKANEIAPRCRKPLTRKRGSPGAGVGEVELAALVEVLAACRARAPPTSASTLSRSVSPSAGSSVEQAELAVAPQDRRLAGLEVDVARAELDGAQRERSSGPSRCGSAAGRLYAGDARAAQRARATRSGSARETGPRRRDARRRRAGTLR